MRADNRKLYIFGRYEYYKSYIKEESQPSYDFTARQRFAFGVNYYPIKQVVFKAEYANRILKGRYNNEPSINIGVAYEGFFM